MTAIVRRILSIPPEGFSPEVQKDLKRTAVLAISVCMAVGALGVLVACLFMS